MEKQVCEDVSPIKHGDLPVTVAMLVYCRVPKGGRTCLPCLAIKPS